MLSRRARTGPEQQLGVRQVVALVDRKFVMHLIYRFNDLFKHHQQITHRGALTRIHAKHHVDGVTEGAGRRV